jgi:hypothetical protein
MGRRRCEPGAAPRRGIERPAACAGVRESARDRACSSWLYPGGNQCPMHPGPSFRAVPPMLMPFMPGADRTRLDSAIEPGAQVSP